MSMNAIDTFLPAAPRAGRNPSETNPTRHTDSGGTAPVSDTSTFGAQVSQTTRIERQAGRDAASQDTATATPEQSASKAVNAQSSQTQTAMQTQSAAQLSQTDQTATPNVNIQAVSALSGAEQTGGTDSTSPPNLPPATKSGDTKTVLTSATSMSDVARSATSPTSNMPAQDQHLQHSSADADIAQPGKAELATSQAPDMAEPDIAEEMSEGDSAAPQQPSTGGDPKLSITSNVSPEFDATTITTGSDPIGDIANAASAGISSADSSDDVENTVAGATAATGATAESTAIAAGKTAQSNFPAAEKPDAATQAATQPDAETNRPAQAADKPNTAPQTAPETSPETANAAQPTATAGSSGPIGQPGTMLDLTGTQTPQAESRRKADAATPAAAPANQAAAATAANGAPATGTAQPAAGAGATMQSAVQSSGNTPNGTPDQSAAMTSPDAATRLAATGRDNGTFGDAIRSAEIRNDAAANRATGFSTSEGGSGLTQTSEAARATTETPQRATTPPPSPPIRDLSMQITRHFEAGTNHFQMRLDPPELGRIDIRMQVTQDGKLSLIVAAEHPETIDLLQRDARALERSLQDAGLKTDSQSLSFSLKDSGKSFAGWRGNEDESAAGGKEDGWDIPAESLAANHRFTDRAVNIQI